MTGATRDLSSVEERVPNALSRDIRKRARKRMRAMRRLPTWMSSGSARSVSSSDLPSRSASPSTRTAPCSISRRASELEATSPAETSSFDSRMVAPSAATASSGMSLGRLRDENTRSNSCSASTAACALWNSPTMVRASSFLTSIGWRVPAAVAALSSPMESALRSVSSSQ